MKKFVFIFSICILFCFVLSDNGRNVEYDKIEGVDGVGVVIDSNAIDNNDNNELLYYDANGNIVLL